MNEELADDEPSHDQPSSSKGHISSLSESHIPTNDDEQTLFNQRKTFANFFEERVDTSFSAFATDSCLNSFNIGWCGGVHIDSCGHFMVK